MLPDAPVCLIDARSYVIPTDAPEADGTIEWDHTTIVVVEATAGGLTGLGYTYASAAAVRVMAEVLAPVVAGMDAMAVGGAWTAMRRAVRNLGRDGLCAAAISAVDAALWDLKRSCWMCRSPGFSAFGGTKLRFTAAAAGPAKACVT